MGKTSKGIFFCRECGYESSNGWLGQCPACKAWNTFVEAPAEPAAKSGKGSVGSAAAAGYGNEKAGQKGFQEEGIDLHYSSSPWQWWQWFTRWTCPP